MSELIARLRREILNDPVERWLSHAPGKPDGPPLPQDVTDFPPDTTPTAAEWLSAMED